MLNHLHFGRGHFHLHLEHFTQEVTFFIHDYVICDAAVEVWDAATLKSSGTSAFERTRNFLGHASYHNNNNVHLSCAHQRPERSHDTY